MKASFSSPGSMMPLPSWSKISKALLISMTSSLGRVRVTKSSALNSFFAGGGAFPPFAPFFIRYQINCDFNKNQIVQVILFSDFQFFDISLNIFFSIIIQWQILLNMMIQFRFLNKNHEKYIYLNFDMKFEQSKEFSQQQQKRRLASTFYGQKFTKTTFCNSKIGSLYEKSDDEEYPFTQNFRMLIYEIQKQKQRLMGQTTFYKEDMEKVFSEIIHLQRIENRQIKKTFQRNMAKQWFPNLKRSMNQKVVIWKQHEKQDTEKIRNQKQIMKKLINEKQIQIANEKKERENSWSTTIDRLGGKLINLQEVISNQNAISEVKMNDLQIELEQIEERIITKIEMQKKKRKKEHNNVATSLQNVMSKLLI